MPRETDTLIEVVVTVADSHLPKINDIVARLGARGLKVTRTMPATGTIAGTTSSLTALSAMKKLAGVEAVEISGSVHVAPPGAGLR